MPNRTQLEGHYVPFADDELEGVIESATFIDRDDGPQEFILHGRDDDGAVWEAHLYCKDGRAFSGTMISKQWDYPYSVEMELWVSPTDEERLLLGTWQVVEDDPVAWRITLWPPEGD
jgi:hypothetical protein